MIRPANEQRLNAERDRKRDERDESNEITIPDVADPIRRAACVADVELFLRTYLAHRFFNPFTDNQREIIAEIRHRARVGGDKAIAAPRGDGKTSLAEGVILFCVLVGELRFPVIVAATASHASQILSNIKNELENNDLLAADFPEICEPIRLLDRSYQRSTRQRYKGKPTGLKWVSNLIVLPTIEGSKASGAVLRCFGILAAVRGLTYLGRRPDFVLFDDVETADSAKKPRQIAKRERAIDTDFAGLGGPGKKLGRLALVTLQNRECLSAKLVDPKQKPTWGGQRFGFFKTWPANSDLWEQYLDLLKTGGESGADPDGRKALAFYLANREAMDADAEVSNPHNFIAELLPGGEPTEISATQHAYNLIGRLGLNSFLCEHQNDPPEDEAPDTSHISATLVESRVSTLPQRVIPNGAVKITAALDVGKFRSHWVVIAWLPGSIGFIVDYSVCESYSPKADDHPAIELAIRQALLSWRADLQADPYRDERGIQRPIDVILIDSGDYSESVYSFCREARLPFFPSKGWGGNYHTPKPGTDKRVGEHWNQSRLEQAGVWLAHLDADHWKRFVHERFLTPPRNDDGTPRLGSLSFFLPAEEDRAKHRTIAHHVVAEVWREQFIPGRGLKVGWNKTSKNNHWLDAIAMACAAADMVGIKLLVATPAAPRPQQQHPPAPLTMPDGRPFMLTERRRR